MEKIELLSPAGDFESLVAAVQNGADAVYFGAEKFNARINSKNFDDELLVKAIEYAKLRNVSTHLTLNIIIKNEEFESAMELVKKVYEAGIDAVIVQDLGLARKIIATYPDLEVHASTQMTTYDKLGVKELEKMGFKRAVLSRELSIEEIEDICKNSNIDIEVFGHGALCISYSGQCLMSSIIGGRSGNRGKCAGTCRLPYKLINKNTNELKESGYLLSSKDVCSLEVLPDLIKAGVKSFKIEGRMKSPEYVGIVTSIYRKYIDLALSSKEYIVEKEDIEKLTQVFNRGGFSTGYLKGKLGRDMIYSKRPNHMGIYIADVISYNKNKGYAKIKLKGNLALGDSIRINDDSCKISEFMRNNNNIKQASMGEVITVGRINGNIKPNDKVYKTVALNLVNEISNISKKENRFRNIDIKLIVKKGKKAEITVQDKISQIVVKKLGEVPEEVEEGIAKDRIEAQISKTGGTVFKADNIEIDLDENIRIPIKDINSLRRTALEEIETKIKESIQRNAKEIQKSKEFAKSKIKTRVRSFFTIKPY